MKTSDLTITIFILCVFIILYVFNVLTVGINKIKEDWALYRCNPAVMPFASVFGQDTSANFTYCIQTMQGNYMSYLMQPLQYNLGVIGDIGATLTKSLNAVRAFFDNIRNFITDIVKSIFAVFLNILIEFQRLTINIKDLFNKLIGIMVTLMYTLNGSIMTVTSAWAGPPGQLTRALCFHPETKIRLKDKSLVNIKDIPLNSVLKNGSIVNAVMHISNLDEKGQCIEALYKVKGGEAQADILVSGSHLVYDPTIQRFIHVENLENVERTEIMCETFTCLITSNHIIPIGQWTFHDWEDNNGSASKDNL
uniref:Uncharacterized protein n=1 Tax=viral metagenome TaxID=1070528 RepID=A0A6C0IIM4_9ZZZZ